MRGKLEWVLSVRLRRVALIRSCYIPTIRRRLLMGLCSRLGHLRAFIIQCFDLRRHDFGVCNRGHGRDRECIRGGQRGAVLGSTNLKASIVGHDEAEGL
jgi:hypothetical protein